MTSPQDYDWKSFQRKLSRGYSLADAAELCRIPIKVALTYAKDNAPQPAAISLELKKVAEYSIKKAMAHLVKLIDEGPRVDETTNQWGGSTHTHHTDLRAAEALLKLGIDTVKMGVDYSPEMPANKGDGGGDKKQISEADLYGPWKLKKPGDFSGPPTSQ